MLLNLIRDKMKTKKKFTTAKAYHIGEQLDVAWDEFDVEQFRKGLHVELEHGTENGLTNVTGDDALLTGKIALAHLEEFPDYYDRLEKMEEEAKEYWMLKRMVNNAMKIL